MAGLTREQRAAKQAKQNATPAVPDGPVPALTVLERRLQNVFGEPSAPVRLKEQGMFARWFNAANRVDAIWRAKEMGWTGVLPEMIVDLSQIGTYTLSAEGYVARGERAQEVLMCMPERAYHQIQMAKTKRNLEMMRDVKGEQHRMMEAASKKMGADFADTMQQHVGPVGGVTDSYERVERVDPDV